ncbi:hypothetical protein EON77_18545 [bacterium]|nr:MAG: hypothetical protein EON77_18545 [bacterium]
MHDLVSAAHDEGAQLLVLPELFSLELLGLEPRLAESKMPRYLAQYAAALEDWLSRIAQNSGLVIVGGSHFREQNGAIVNTAPIAFPDGQVVFQTKNNLTEYERDVWPDSMSGHVEGTTFRKVRPWRNKGVIVRSITVPSTTAAA